MVDKKKVKDALYCLRPVELEYDEWLHIGMALKEAGIDYSVWDEWSSSDPIKYHDGECKRKWDGFNGSDNPITIATIFKMAKDRGYSTKRANRALDWNDVIGDDGKGNEEVLKPLKPAEQLKEFLSVLFDPDDKVGLVTGDVWQSQDGKWNPSKGVYDRTAAELVKSLDAHPDDLGATIGDWKQECGAWIRFNPLDGNGVKNENVTKFKYALVESDEMSIDDQEKLYRKLQLPIATLTYSGGKSLHAIVRVDAKNADEYRKRVEYLYGYLEKNGAKVDKQNKNPSRLTRMPGVTRNGKEQKLLAVNIGKSSWAEWENKAKDDENDLPPLIYLIDFIADPPKPPQELIENALRCSHKALLAAQSKAGKSFALMELCAGLSEGSEWLGLNCKKVKVLYVNLEIDPASCIDRFVWIYKTLGLDFTHSKNIAILNLRGRATPLDELAPKLIGRMANEQFGAVIIDPIYKIMTGDENSASDMGYFCNQFDKICQATGCATIYAHHHSKGAQGNKFVADRASGSGVFARDVDALFDLIRLNANRAFLDRYAPSRLATPWRMESTLREFPNLPPRNLWFDCPIHKLDTSGVLEGLYSDGDPVANLAKSSKRNQSPANRKAEFDNAFDLSRGDDGTCSATDLAEYLGVSERTIRARVTEFGDTYSTHKGIITRKTEAKNEQ